MKNLHQMMKRHRRQIGCQKLTSFVHKTVLEVVALIWPKNEKLSSSISPRYNFLPWWLVCWLEEQRAERRKNKAFWLTSSKGDYQTKPNINMDNDPFPKVTNQINPSFLERGKAKEPETVSLLFDIIYSSKN